MIAAEGCVVGVDVGYSPTRRSSAICCLFWSIDRVAWDIVRFRAIEPERENTIAAILAGHQTSVAAFDGSLRRGFDLIGRYRSAERMLTRRLAPLIGKPGQSSTPSGKLLNHHANLCAQLVLAHGAVLDARHHVAIDSKAVVEAFPSSFLGLMIQDPKALVARRADRSDVFFRHLAKNGTLSALLAHCLPGRRLFADPGAITNHDDRAAFVSALTALSVARNEYVAVGDPVDGWIILPPRRFIQSTQWNLLALNARDEPVGTLHVAGRDSNNV